jgi:hypothetical protein
MLGDVIAASAILVAYLLTAATVLPAIEEKAIVQRLRSWKYYDYIIGYIGRGAWAAGFLLLISLVAILLPDLLHKVAALKDEARLINRLFSALWWSTLFLTVHCVFIATRILLKMLRAV